MNLYHLRESVFEQNAQLWIVLQLLFIQRRWCINVPFVDGVEMIGHSLLQHRYGFILCPAFTKQTFSIGRDCGITIFKCAVTYEGQVGAGFSAHYSLILQAT